MYPRREPRPRRDWVEAITKILQGVAALAAGVLIPYVIYVASERNQNNNLYANLVSQREVSDSTLRAQMFETLLKSLFSDSKTKPQGEKISILRLLAVNFHEFFDLEPVFDHIERNGKLTKKERAELKEIAQEVVDKQEAMLAQVAEGTSFEDTVFEGNTNAITVPPMNENAYHNHRLGITVSEVNPEEEYARLHVQDMPESGNVGTLAAVEFKLNRYDAPFTNHTKLANNVRFAVTFKGIAPNDKAVRIKVIFFPDYFLSGRDRPQFDEMLRHLESSRTGFTFPWFNNGTGNNLN